MRIPWKLLNAYNKLGLATRYFSSKLLAPRADEKPEVQFFCGFHGNTGGAEAIAAIANLLSDHYRVTFVAGPTSPFNRWLDRKVGRIKAVSSSADYYICDRGASNHDIQVALKANKPLIASIHGSPMAGHGLEGESAFRIFDKASHIHFLTRWQAEAFEKWARNFTIIPNATQDMAIKDSAVSGHKACVGMVGHFQNIPKNLEGNLEAVRASTAAKAFVWGEAPGKISDKHIEFKGFEHNKQRIFNSFRVFVSLSRTETQQLAVSQALSVGLPCVLSDIAGHRIYANCPGVFFVGEDDTAGAAQKIDEALGLDDAVKTSIRGFWEEHFSEEAVRKDWLDFLRSL